MPQLVAYAYLAAALLLLATTLAALVPRLFPHVLGAGMAISSLVLVFFIPQAVVLGLLATALVARLDVLGHPAAQAGLALQCLTWVLLLVYFWRAHASRPLLDGVPVADDHHPFSAGLSDDERRSLTPASVSWRAALLFWIPEILQVKVTRNVVYREVDGVRLRLDVYRPKEAGAHPLPAVMYIHGGGWVTGTRRQSRFMCYQLAAAGWVVFAISYRLAPRFPLPAALEDCKAAIAWIREHGAACGARASQLVVVGGSAGGHLAAMMALTAGEKQFQPGFEQADTHVQGAVVFYGVTDFEATFGPRGNAPMAILLERLVFRRRYRDHAALFRACQPTSYLSAAAPPMLLVHGSDDALVPVEESRAFQKRLLAAGAAQVHLLEVPYGLHAFEIFPSVLHQRALRVVLRFLSTLRSGVAADGPSRPAP